MINFNLNKTINLYNFRAHSCDFWGKVVLEKNNVQTVQEWTQSYIELIAFYMYTQKIAIIFGHI